MITTSDKEFSDIIIQAWLDDALSSQILGYFVHGIYTGIFGIAIWQLLAVKNISKARIYMGCIITALYIFSMIYVIASWIEFSRAYIFATSFRARYDMMYSSAPCEIMGVTATALNLIIADCTIIWRCWVVWAHDWRVIILPIFFVIGETVCGVNGVVHKFIVSLNDETGTNWAVATMAATLGTNILCTALIVARIIYVARRQRGIMGGIRTYRGVIEIVVESATLYSAMFLVFMILYLLEGNGYMYPQALVYPVTCIAPTLIIFRVASGQGRPEESLIETQSSLHFQTSRGSTIETATDGGEEDMIRENTKGTAHVLLGSVEQV
ncbi:hypothetical protein EDD85DRAFT_98935 [Armillaria nabsnona]|nr:hypothetical protein EDD85DRAFT_98935 [Armillaria nabsnona]